MIAISPNKNQIGLQHSWIQRQQFLKSGTVMASRVRGKDTPHPGWSSESRGLSSLQKKPYPHQQERFWQAWGWRTLGMAGRYRQRQTWTKTWTQDELFVRTTREVKASLSWAWWSSIERQYTPFYTVYFDIIVSQLNSTESRWSPGQVMYWSLTSLNITQMISDNHCRVYY